MASRTTAPSPNLLPAATTMDAVTLYVRDIDAMIAFYTNVITLDVLTDTTTHANDARTGIVTLGRGTTPIIVLRHEPNLPQPTRTEAGLFHTAILFPTQRDLARVLLSVAQKAPQLFTGSADHLVSQAFYLNDPEGNGIELYWDRTRDQWQWNGNHVVMDSLWLDPNGFITEHLGDTPADAPHAPAGEAQVGHVHLQVGDTDAAASFYSAILGFEPTAQVPGALFVAAGGYHHHMAMNTWNSRGAGPRASSLGLGEVSIMVPHNDDIAALSDRLKHHRITAAHTGAALTFEDPWRNRLAVSVTPSHAQ